jgi:beta-N-acetylhexosaminidase
MLGRMNDAGRVLMVGFSGSRLEPELLARLRALQPGGVILFRRNLESPEALQDLVLGLREVLPPHPLLAVDQEGGRVSRLEPWLGPTPTAERWSHQGEEAVHRFGAATGQVLRGLGFNLDFAPVVDLCPPGTPNGIGDRSFGTDPEAVATQAGAFLDGLQAAGVAGCLKHFPGLGDTHVDSHRELPTVTRARERLLGEDLLPYRRLQDRAAAVMTGHALYPTLVPGTRLPACLSPEIVRGWLRERLGFAGLAVSDDLEMGAVEAFEAERPAGLTAVEAGCDLVLYCHTLERAERARDAMVARAEEDPAFAARLREAASVVARTGRTWPARAPDPAAWAEARRSMQELSALA